MTSPGLAGINDMLGGENLASDLSAYYNKINPSIYAGTVILAHNMNWIFTHSEYINNFDSDGYVNAGQAVYNALYTYGAGTKLNNYYGYNSNGEAPMSAAYKMYIYYTLCEVTGTECAVGKTDNIDKSISDYTNLGGGNIWEFEFKKIELN